MSCVCSCTILLEPGLFNFTLIEVTLEWFENIGAVTLGTYGVIEEYGSNYAPTTYGTPHPNFLITARLFLKCMRIVAASQMCILAVHVPGKVEPCLICEGGYITDFRTFLNKGV